MNTQPDKIDNLAFNNNLSCAKFAVNTASILRTIKAFYAFNAAKTSVIRRIVNKEISP
jgi:hypothetical protein